MQRMHFDFLQPHARHPGLGMLLLLAGVASAGLLLAQHYKVSQETTLFEERISDARRMERRAMPHLETRRSGRALAEEIRDANAVIARMNIPWDALFRDLESAADEGVALLAIQPDPASQQVRIDGEARKLETVLGYVKRLQAREGLTDVFLLGHEMRDAPPRPVTFTLTARWTGPR